MSQDRESFYSRETELIPLSQNQRLSLFLTLSSPLTTNQLSLVVNTNHRSRKLFMIILASPLFRTDESIFRFSLWACYYNDAYHHHARAVIRLQKHI